MSADRPATRSKRFFKLAGMTASVAGGYATTRFKSLFQSARNVEAAKRLNYQQTGTRIAETLGELKGAVMKVGQMASIASDILPAELSAALRRLQKEAPPMAFEVIREVIEAELGAPPEVLFQRFDPVPFASASIGQVHRARTDDGREVICKVQYPGVEDAVDSDLMHLKIALRASGLVKISRRALNETLAELRSSLHRELDYCIEADSVRLFRDFHGEHHPFVVIPDVVGERSAQRVLTLTFEHGHTVEELDHEGYSQADRDRIGERLVTMIASQIFELGAIHADPNPGNFVFRPDGTLVAYDFGCIKVLPVEVVQACHDLLLAGLAEDYTALDECLVRLGARDPDGPPVPHSYYKTWRDIFGLPFLQQDVFDFGAAKIHEAVVKQIPGAIKYMTAFKPAKELILLDRMIAGHYGNLVGIGAQVPVWPLLRGYVEGFAPEKLEVGTRGAKKPG